MQTKNYSLTPRRSVMSSSSAWVYSFSLSIKSLGGGASMSSTTSIGRILVHVQYDWICLPLDREIEWEKRVMLPEIKHVQDTFCTHPSKITYCK